ncbi:MAG TPA: GAF domain-containing protein [Chloroflexia bacterium]|nr:GAF domain-containing protein [Chloroflexia bacterium]
MDRNKLAEILDSVSERVKEHWRVAWQDQIGAALARNQADYNLYMDEYVQPKDGNKRDIPLELTLPPADAVAERSDVCAEPGEGDQIIESSLIDRPITRSPMALSAHNIYPDYFDKLVEHVRNDDMEAFCDFMSVEGSKWALVEVPVDELVSQTMAYCQEIVDAVYNADEVTLEPEERRQVVRALDNLGRRVAASITKGYVEGRDRLLMRALASNRPAEENFSLSPIVKGTVMGGFGEQVRRSLDELEALHKVNSAVNSSLDLDSVLNLTVQAVAEVMNVDVCAVYVFDKEQEQDEMMVLRAAKGLNQRAIGTVRVRVGEGVTGASAKEGKPISVYDIWADTRFRYVPTLNEDSSRSMLSVPVILFTREKLVGVINVQSRSYRSWTTEEIRFLEMVAGEIAMAIENARLYQQTDERLRQKVQELTTLQNVSNMVAATLDLSRVLHLIVEQASELVKADMSSIYELKEDSPYLTIVAAHGLSDDYVRNMRVKLGEGPVGRSAELNRPVNVWDAHFELHPGESYYFNSQYRSAMCVPLTGARGVLGVICLYTRDQRHFNDEQLQIIAAFADQAAIAIENARLYEEARRGLSIKSALLQEMHHRVRNNLQTVAALLSMQMRRAPNPEVQVPLSESVARIQSIAAIHDLLSREDIGVTTVQAVAKEITDIASVSLVPSYKRIRFKIDEGPVPVASKEATLLAILIMELVSNAIFHGFEDRNEGEIRISAFKDEGRVQIEVRDNGKGYPTEFNLETAKTGLGMQIVRTLVTKDLQGIFRVENINGWATATIIFNSVYGQQTENEVGDEVAAY